MSVRQYIGARYVPRFLGTWNNTTQYEALDVVDNGSGTSYIARKNVPAGTPLNNTDFWFVYGASSGAIISLQNRMDAAENDIDDLEEDVTYLTSKDSHLTDRKIMLIGDSYSMTGQPYTSWHTLFESLTGTTCIKYADNGGGFVASGRLGTFKDVFNNAAVVDGLTDIVVCGGANDNTAHNAGATQAAVINAIEAFGAAVYAIYPNVNIHIGFIGGSTDSAYIAPLIAARDAYRDGSFKIGANFIDASDALKLSDVMTDYLHPTTQGMSYIVRYILSGVIGGNYHTYRKLVTCPLTAKSDVTLSTGTFTSYYNQYDQNLEMKLDGTITIDFSSAITLSPIYKELATVAVTPETVSKFDSSVSGVLLSGGNVIDGVGLSFRLIGDTLYVKSTAQYSNVTRIVASNVSMIGII